MTKNHQQKSWRARNPDKLRQYNKKALTRKTKWARNNYRKNRRACRIKQNSYRAQVKREVFVHYFGDNPKCIGCGISDLRVLSIHHKNGDGKAHRRRLFKHAGQCGMNFYVRLKTVGFPTDRAFELLCANCHLIKESEIVTPSDSLKV